MWEYFLGHDASSAGDEHAPIKSDRWSEQKESQRKENMCTEEGQSSTGNPKQQSSLY